MKETDLYLPIKRMLEEQIGCNAVYAEIMDVDVLGLNGVSNIIVEMKKCLNFKLIEQAYRGLKYAHHVYIAIPYSKTSHHWIYHNFLKEKGIGIIEVRENYNGELEAKILYKAKFNRIKKSNRDYIRRQIEHYSNNNVGGSKSGETITRYSDMISKIKKYMKRQGWITVDKILEDFETYYAQPKSSLTSVLRNFNTGWCETKIINGKRFFRHKRSSLFTVYGYPDKRIYNSPDGRCIVMSSRKQSKKISFEIFLIERGQYGYNDKRQFKKN